MNRRLLLFATLVFAGCGGKKVEPPPPAETILTTYRAISGASMGGIGTAALTATRPEAFDGAGSLGGPLDAAFLLRSFDSFHLGSFCSRADLQALLAQNPANLNDPSKIDPCTHRPATIPIEHSQDFNHWVATTNGGSFDRDEYVDIFEDLTLAYGNAIYENPDSALAPPGVDPVKLYEKRSNYCTTPAVVKNFKNAEYNPTGQYDAITFCDGQQDVYFCRNNLQVVDFCSNPANIANPLPRAQWQAFADTYCASQGGGAVALKGEQPLMVLANWGRVDACRLQYKPMVVGLALDMNGNGRRDYGEPVLNNGQERFSDVGADGCPDAQEDGHGGCNAAANASGDPNGDDYDAEKNPLGTEANWIHDNGEPFRDDGLDGVPGTADFGEGNGQFDMSSGRKRLFERDLRTKLASMDDKGRKRLQLYVDGGLRDVFNLGLMSKQVFGFVASYAPSISGSFRAFEDVPGMMDRTNHFNPWAGNFRLAPKNMLVLYGKDNPTDDDRIAGEGDHVGDPSEAVNRFAMLFGWTSSLWPSLPRPATAGGASFSTRLLNDQWFYSNALKAKRDYSVFLPPGYDLPENAETRYPVTYMLHGYGMDASGMAATSAIADPNMTAGGGGNLHPMILVFPSGRCCRRNAATNSLDCREKNDQGVSYDTLAGWKMECNSGTFFTNGQGYANGAGYAYGDAFFELVDEIDTKYRTLKTAEVTAR